MKSLEIIADNLSKAGWSWGCVSAVDSRGRTIWIADAHCDDGQRFIVRADEKLTAFVELESAIRGRGAVSWQDSGSGDQQTPPPNQHADSIWLSHKAIPWQRDKQ